MPDLYTFPPIKKLLKVIGKNLTIFCQKCNANRFDNIISYLFNQENDTCLNCRLQASILKPILLNFFALYGINHETVQELCSNVALRKVIKNYFKGLALFGVRIPHVGGSPLAVVWNFTKKCNLKCPHCFSDAKYNQRSKNELNTEQAKRVIDILSANDVITLNFCGGEPLTREDVFELMKHASDNEILPSISTNATLLSKEYCQKLHDAGVRSLDISLDSTKAEVHDRLRGVRGAFELAIEGINNAAEFGKFDEIILNTTLTDYNHHEIPQIYEFARELGANKYYVSRILPTGRGKNYMNHDVDNETKIKIMKFMAKKFIKHVLGKDELMVLGRGMTYYSKTCHDLSRGNIYPVCEILTGFEPQHQNLFNGKAANLVKVLSRFFSGCATALFYIGMDCDGNLIPCAPADHIKLGNVLEKGLQEIWVNNPLLNQIRERSRIKGKCSECDANNYCGGCRLTAYGLTGSWLGSDLSCPY